MENLKPGTANSPNIPADMQHEETFVKKEDKGMKEVLDQQLEILKTLNQILKRLDAMTMKQKSGKF